MKYFRKTSIEQPKGWISSALIIAVITPITNAQTLNAYGQYRANPLTSASAYNRLGYSDSPYEKQSKRYSFEKSFSDSLNTLGEYKDGTIAGSSPDDQLMQLFNQNGDIVQEVNIDPFGRYEFDSLDVGTFGGRSSTAYRTFSPKKQCFSKPMSLQQNNPYVYQGRFECQERKRRFTQSSRTNPKKIYGRMGYQTTSSQATSRTMRASRNTSPKMRIPNQGYSFNQRYAFSQPSGNTRPPINTLYGYSTPSPSRQPVVKPPWRILKTPIAPSNRSWRTNGTSSTGSQRPTYQVSGGRRASTWLSQGTVSRYAQQNNFNRGITPYSYGTQQPQSQSQPSVVVVPQAGGASAQPAYNRRSVISNFPLIRNDITDKSTVGIQANPSNDLLNKNTNNVTVTSSSSSSSR